MSAGMRWMARMEQSAMVRAATMMVIGRRSASRTSHMLLALASVQKWLQIALSGRDREHRAPDIQVREREVDLGLGQQTLGFSYLDQRSETGFVARGRLL